MIDMYYEYLFAFIGKKYEGINNEEANIEHFTCFYDRKCRAPVVPGIDCCFNIRNYIKIRGRCCPW